MRYEKPKRCDMDQPWEGGSVKRKAYDIFFQPSRAYGGIVPFRLQDGGDGNVVFLYGEDGHLFASRRYADLEELKKLATADVVEVCLMIGNDAFISTTDVSLTDSMIDALKKEYGSSLIISERK